VGPANFEFRDEPAPTPGPGEILVKSLYLSFDPAMRGWMEDRPSYIPPVGLGEVMRAAAVGQVIESNDESFPVGSYVSGFFGWQEYAIAGRGRATPIAEGTSLTWPIGVLGITGLTAYFGMLEVGKPKAGETVVVSGAAGATGSIAAQIARIQGARAIGIAGGAEKCAWLRDAAKLDAAIDYKSEDVGARLAALCPNGIDVFFDNVGGDILDIALTRLARHARVVICGAISQYNNTAPVKGPANYLSLLVYRASMTGMVVFDYAKRYPDAVRDLAGWMAAGKLKSREHIVEGLETFPEALQMLFSGANMGKLVLKVASE